MQKKFAFISKIPCEDRFIRALSKVNENEVLLSFFALKPQQQVEIFVAFK